MSDDERRKVLRPIFGRPEGASVFTPDFLEGRTVNISIGGIEVSLIHGSLFDTDADGFVIPQFSNKVSTGGVAFDGKAIYGEAFNKAYEQYLGLYGDSHKNARVISYRDEEAKKFFFHTVTVQTGYEKASQNVADAVQYVLALCQQKGLRSIGLPALCTGVQGELLDEQSAKTIAHAIYTFRQNTVVSGEIPKVILAISGYESRARFDTFARIFKTPELYETFDPASEIGQRPKDVNQRLHEESKKGTLLAVDIVAGNGEVIISDPMANDKTVVPFLKPKHE